MTSDKRTLFILDDERESVQAVRRLVAPMNLRVRSFCSSHEFLSAVDGQGGGCLVTELRATAIDAMELLRVFEERDINLPIIVLTRCADVPSTVAVLQGGAYTLIEKPFPNQVLWDAIRSALELYERIRQAKSEQLELQSRLEALSEQELEIAEMIVGGMPNKTVASRLELSLRTIEGRRKEVFRKTGTKCVAELVTLLYRARHPAGFCHQKRQAGACYQQDDKVYS